MLSNKNIFLVFAPQIRVSKTVNVHTASEACVVMSCSRIEQHVVICFELKLKTGFVNRH